MMDQHQVGLLVRHDTTSLQNRSIASVFAALAFAFDLIHLPKWGITFLFHFTTNQNMINLVPACRTENVFTVRRGDCDRFSKFWWCENLCWEAETRLNIDQLHLSLRYITACIFMANPSCALVGKSFSCFQSNHRKYAGEAYHSELVASFRHSELRKRIRP